MVSVKTSVPKKTAYEAVMYLTETIAGHGSRPNFKRKIKYKRYPVERNSGTKTVDGTQPDSVGPRKGSSSATVMFSAA
jgi:hypothetical protein